MNETIDHLTISTDEAQIEIDGRIRNLTEIAHNQSFSREATGAPLKDYYMDQLRAEVARNFPSLPENGVRAVANWMRDHPMNTKFPLVDVETDQDGTLRVTNIREYGGLAVGISDFVSIGK